MTPETQLKGLIKERYGSVLAFASICGIKESSIRNLFNRGITNINLSTATTLCHFLNLDIDALCDGRIEQKNDGTDPLSPSDQQILKLFRQLNADGQSKLFVYAQDLVASGRYTEKEGG